MFFLTAALEAISRKAYRMGPADRASINTRFTTNKTPNTYHMHTAQRERRGKKQIRISYTERQRGREKEKERGRVRVMRIR